MKENATIINSIQTSAAEIILRSDGIIHFSVMGNISITVKDAKEMVDAAGQIGGEKKYPILISAGKYTLAEKEAREFAAGTDGNKYTIAGAFVVKSLAQKQIAKRANYLNRFNTALSG